MQVLTFVLVLGILRFNIAEDCVSRTFPDGIVCVCNSTYCDSITVDVPERGKFKSYISSRDGKRFDTEDGIFEDDGENEILLNLNANQTFQTILGFGGAFTDSAGFNINKLTQATQEQLMQAYYNESGSKYSLGRVPVGGTDFSNRPYTLDDSPGDVHLTNFTLAPEDVNYKIPYMKRALEINPQLRFIAASWTAPPWMKTNNDYIGLGGRLRDLYYQTYADYLVLFLESYKNENLPIWAISTGNEPIDGFIPLVSINDMGWSPSASAKWLVNNFGPSIERSKSNETMILALDDQRFTLPMWIDRMYKANSEVDKYISGIAIHWYGDILSPAKVFDTTHEKYPDKFLIMTEACMGSLPFQKKVSLGSWPRGEAYISSIIEDLNHWVTSWLDWNIALDKNGGPTWARNFVDSPIIVNPETDEFFKQPMYYAIAHVSKFVPINSVRIHLTSRNNLIKSVAFKTPENNIVIVLFNPSNGMKSVTINDEDHGNLNIQMHARSIRTIIYNQ